MASATKLEHRAPGGDVWQAGTKGRTEYNSESLPMCSALGYNPMQNVSAVCRRGVGWTVVEEVVPVCCGWGWRGKGPEACSQEIACCPLLLNSNGPGLERSFPVEAHWEEAGVASSTADSRRFSHVDTEFLHYSTSFSVR